MDCKPAKPSQKIIDLACAMEAKGSTFNRVTRMMEGMRTMSSDGAVCLSREDVERLILALRISV